MFGNKLLKILKFTKAYNSTPGLGIIKVLLYFLITGGALSQAKGAFSNWWSNLTTPQSPTDTTPDLVESTEKSVIEENITNPIIEV